MRVSGDSSTSMTLDSGGTRTAAQARVLAVLDFGLRTVTFSGMNAILARERYEIRVSF
jgi:hypothetical protein